MTSSSLWQRLKQGLQKTTTQVEGTLRDLFQNHKVDENTLDALEDALIQADIGPETAQNLRVSLEKLRQESAPTLEDVQTFLADAIEKILTPCEKPLHIGHKPHVIFLIGVNGSGKTTTIGKLAHWFTNQGKAVEVAACDTFRAAAVEQLRVWASRAHIPIHTTHPNGDAAGLAYDAFLKAQNSHADILMVDTAGRLHNKDNLMDELKKMIRVVQKIDPTAPHEILLVLDGTTGQNAHQQIAIFKKEAAVTGLILTKLDGTAKGGVVVALAAQHGLPIYALGVGEKIDDLQPFSAAVFAKNLVGMPYSES
jgi:fused signal recognition particle receptor